MAASFKLVYFKIHGRAQCIRLAAAIGNVAYEDEFVDFADWPAKKAQSPGGALPYIQVGDKALSQSNAALVYVGSLAGLYPESVLDRTSVQEVLSTVEDIYHQIGPSFRESDPEKKKALRIELSNVKLPAAFANLERIVAREGHGYFAGDKLTIADLKAFSLLWWIKSGLLDDVDTTLVDPFPGLSELYNRVSALPAVKHHLETFNK